MYNEQSVGDKIRIYYGVSVSMYSACYCTVGIGDVAVVVGISKVTAVRT
jgi:hypothetical protein